MKTIRASEIGTYLYCRRAWGYARSGAPSENQSELAAGTELHAHHGKVVLFAGCLHALAYGLLLLALALLAVYLVQQVI